MLDDDPAVRLHDPLRQAGRPRRVEHPQRLVERHRRELQRRRRGGELRPRHRALQRGVGVEVRHEHRRPQRGQRLLQRGDGLAHVERPAVVAVAVDGDQHRGLDLREAVEHRTRPEVRRARRPHGAERRRREERDQGLDGVRHQCDDPVAAAHTRRRQARAGPPDQVAQLRVRDDALAVAVRTVVLHDPDRGDVVVAPAGTGGQRVLRVVERRTREPLGARHLAPAERRGRRLVEDHAEVLGDRGPESVEVAHGPVVQTCVVQLVSSEPVIHPAVLLHPAREPRDPRPARLLRVRGPQHGRIFNGVVLGGCVHPAISLHRRPRVEARALGRPAEAPLSPPPTGGRYLLARSSQVVAGRRPHV